MNRKLTILLLLLALVVIAVTGPEFLALGLAAFFGFTAFAWWSTRHVFRRMAGLTSAQIIFLWGLASAVIWGFIGAYALYELEMSNPAAVTFLFSLFAVIAWGFIILVRLSWPVMAVARGGHAIATGVILSPVMLAWVFSGLFVLDEVLGTRTFNIPVGERWRSWDAGEVAWRRPLPGEMDLVKISANDFNPRSGLTVFESVSDAVVSISNHSQSGTAFLITKDGLAITNHHVIDGTPPFVARFRDGSERPVRVIRANRELDAALVQIACESDCVTVTLAADADPKIGSEVLVVGMPYSLNHSVAKGIVSGLRFVDGGTHIQIDAPVNHGNSGGPIVDAASGEVLGIVSWKVVSEDIEGLGFGVAIGDALRGTGGGSSTPDRAVSGNQRRRGKR
jgi:hypothetical protein